MNKFHLGHLRSHTNDNEETIVSEGPLLRKIKCALWSSCDQALARDWLLVAASVRVAPNSTQRKCDSVSCQVVGIFVCIPPHSFNTLLLTWQQYDFSVRDLPGLRWSLFLDEALVYTPALPWWGYARSAADVGGDFHFYYKMIYSLTGSKRASNDPIWRRCCWYYPCFIVEFVGIFLFNASCYWMGLDYG